MAVTPATLTLDSDDISPNDLGVAITEFSALLAALDRDLSADRDYSLRWRVSGLEYGSATMLVEAEPLEDAPDIGPKVVAALVGGIGLIEREAIRPDEYSDEALEHLRSLATLLRNGTRNLIVRAPTLQAEATITPRTLGTIDVVIGQAYTSVGVVEGTLEAISLHGRPYFTVYDAVTGRAVHCWFSLTVKQQVIEALGLKVIVTGSLRRDLTGRPRDIRNLDEFRVLGLPVAHSALELAGLLRGMSKPTTELLAEIRGEQ